MVSSILKIGDKLDIRILQQAEKQSQDKKQDGESVSVWKSMIYDMKADGTIEIAMPMEGSKMILLNQGIRYELVFQSNGSRYRCIAQVKERYKIDNLYMVAMELLSGFTKVQRREFYRYECLLDIDFLPITVEEAKMKDVDEMMAHHLKEYPDDLIQNGIAVDISGGGLRFVSTAELEYNSFALVHLKLVNQSVERDFWIMGRILNKKQLEKNPPKHEYRIQFKMKNNRIQEQIIKYIFEEERMSRKNEKG